MELVVALSVLAGFAVAMFAIYCRLFRVRARLPVTAEWIDDLSVDGYQPMMRLLENDDIRLLRAQPGFTRQMAAKLRRERCRVFRSYLRCLNSDFQQISLALKIVMVQSRYDRPDLAAALVRSRWAFVWCMVWVHCRLTLYRFGLASVEVAALLKVFDRARLELRSLVPAQAGLSVSCP